MAVIGVQRTCKNLVKTYYFLNNLHACHSERSEESPLGTLLLDILTRMDHNEGSQLRSFLSAEADRQDDMGGLCYLRIRFDGSMSYGDYSSISTINFLTFNLALN